MSRVRSFRHDFEKLVAAHADQPCFVVDAGLAPITLSYAEVSQRVDRCLSFFEQEGLKPGDVVLALMPNSAEMLVLCLATMKGGYVLAPLPCTATRREIDRWLALIRPGLIVASPLVSDEARMSVESADARIAFVETDTSFEWLPAQREPGRLGDEPRIYLATSGTTGEPEAMVLDANRLWSSGHAFLQFHGLLDSELRFWNFLPMSYLGGVFNLGLIPLASGGSIVIGEPFSGKTFLQFWQTIDRFDIDALWLVPTIVRGLLKLARRANRDDLENYGERIRIAFFGTAPVELAVKTEFEALTGITLLENFALSETTFITSETPRNIESRSEASVGEVLPYADLRLVRVESEEQEEGPHEIHVRTPFLFLGYLQANGEIVAPVDDEGYLPTGDLGHLSEDHLLVLDGRTRDIVKKGGYFVALREIEIVAQQHDAVREAAAVRVPHEFYGESFELYVIADDRSEERSRDQLGTYLHTNLVNYKWPERIIWVDDFPRTASGKVRKHLLRDP